MNYVVGIIRYDRVSKTCNDVSDTYVVSLSYILRRIQSKIEHTNLIISLILLTSLKMINADTQYIRSKHPLIDRTIFR